MWGACVFYKQMQEELSSLINSVDPDDLAMIHGKRFGYKKTKPLAFFL